MLKEIVKPTLVLFLVCAVVTGALAYVNEVTAPIIVENEKLVKQEAMISVLPGATAFSAPKTAEQLKKDGFSVGDGIVSLYEAKDVGYVVEILTQGYGGTINMLVGVDQEKNIKGVKLVSHEETPGLGAKTASTGFTGQYLGAIPSDGFKVVRGAARADGEIAAVSGATISSRAVTQGVADAAELVSSIIDNVKEDTRDPKLVVLPGSTVFSEPEPAEQLKGEGLEVGETIVNLYKAEGVGYAVEVSSQGYHDVIKMMIGFDLANNITGVKVTEHHETSGLGSGVAEQDYLEQYVGPIPDKFMVVTREAGKDGEIEAVSGATKSSRAVAKGVTEAAALIRSMSGGK